MNLYNYARLFCSPTFISKYDTRFWRIINFFSADLQTKQISIF